MVMQIERELGKLWREKGPAWTSHHVQEALAKKELNVNDFSIRRLAENTIKDGYEWVASLDPTRRGGGMVVQEAIHAVDTSAMANITGQLVFSAIQDGMQLDELIGDTLVSDFPSNFQDDEKLPGISAVSDDFEDNVVQGEPYPPLGLSEEWVIIPAAEKKGGILGITREALIADRTGVLVERARSVGEALAIRRERSILDVVIGAVNPYNRKGEARLTYANAGMGFDNEGQAELINYTDLQEMAELFYAMRDPNTGEPLGHTPTTLVMGKGLEWTARAVIRDTLVELVDRAAAAGQVGSAGMNRIPWNLTIRSNEWVIERILAANGGPGGITAADRAAANDYWFLGKPTAAFVWKVIWPLTVTEAPNNSEVDFTQDVVMRFKASHKGVAGVREPRLMIRSDGTA